MFYRNSLPKYPFNGTWFLELMLEKSQVFALFLYKMSVLTVFETGLLLWAKVLVRREVDTKTLNIVQNAVNSTLVNIIVLLLRNACHALMKFSLLRPLPVFIEHLILIYNTMLPFLVLLQCSDSFELLKHQKTFFGG